jgi:hypothetical protein
MDEKVVRVITPPFTLPSPIDSLPVYNIPNFEEPGVLWGSSEMRGLERIMAAIDQGISDEELTLAMDGLGTYATDAGAPIDEDTGEELPWDLGPAKVVEVPAGSFFNRVSGVSSVSPYQDHLSYLHSQLDEASTIPDVAKGYVDATIAESGIALTLKLAPIISKAGEKDLAVVDRMTNLLYDLSKWFVAYEGTAFNSLLEVTRWVPVFGPKIPINEAKRFDQIMTAIGNGSLPLLVAWDEMRKLGWELPDNDTMQKMLIDQKAADASLQADALATRVNGEMQQAATDLATQG